jgi:hypothetical protein
MPLDPTRNFAKVTVDSIGYDADDVLITLSAGHGARLPNPDDDGAFNLVWWNDTDYGDPTDDPYVEIVRCTDRATDVLTVTRARENTSGSAKNIAAKTYRMILAMTKKMIDDIEALAPKIITEKIVTGKTQSGNDVVINLSTALSQSYSTILLVSRGGQIQTPTTDWSQSGNNITVFNADVSEPFLIQYIYS